MNYAHTASDSIEFHSPDILVYYNRNLKLLQKLSLRNFQSVKTERYSMFQKLVMVICFDTEREKKEFVTVFPPQD